MDKWIIEEPSQIIFTVNDPEGIIVSLYSDQWKHIKKEHPEIKPINRIKSAVRDPDIIISDKNRDARIYTVISSLKFYFNVYAGIISETDYKIRTAHITGKLPNGECIWQRPKR
jgi:hypothetical protein